MDLVKASLWGAALLLHISLCLAFWAILLLSPWRPAYNDEIIPTALETLRKFKLLNATPASDFARDEPPGLNEPPGLAAIVGERRKNIIGEMRKNEEIKKVVEACTGCKVWYFNSNDAVKVVSQLNALSQRAVMADYHRWFFAQLSTRIVIALLQLFLLLSVLRARRLTARPYLSWLVVLAPICVFLWIPTVVVFHHPINGGVTGETYKLFPYWVAGAIIFIFLAWPPLFIILKRKGHALRQMAWAVCTGRALQGTAPSA